jgi:hypothetical protein
MRMLATAVRCGRTLCKTALWMVAALVMFVILCNSLLGGPAIDQYCEGILSGSPILSLIPIYDCGVLEVVLCGTLCF